VAINTSIREALQAPIFKTFDDVSENALWSIILIRLLLSRRALITVRGVTQSMNICVRNNTYLLAPSI
jgi:hypothetical protein